MGAVSRGGSFHTAMMLASGEENPLYAEYDYLLEILDEYEIALSLGDGMRPGAYVDSGKLAKSQEYLTLGKLARIAHTKGVQRMIEGPGHMDYNEVAYNVKMIKEITDFAPLYLLGPLVSDIAPGYDHITGAIGGATAAGADFLCMVSPSEHLALPDTRDIIEGTRVAKVAAHVGVCPANARRSCPGRRRWRRHAGRWTGRRSTRLRCSAIMPVRCMTATAPARPVRCAAICVRLRSLNMRWKKRSEFFLCQVREPFRARLFSGYLISSARTGQRIVGMIRRYSATDRDPITSAAQPMAAAPRPPTPMENPRVSPEAKPTLPGRRSCVMVTDMT